MPFKFDAQAIVREQYQPRTGEIPIPAAVKELIASDDDSEETPNGWAVRGLTGLELDRAEEARQGTLNQLVIQISTMIGSGQAPESADMSDQALARAKRIAVLTQGCVEPPLDNQAAILLCDHFGVFAAMLEKKIYDLTGLGSVPGKPNGSIGTPTSNPP